MLPPPPDVRKERGPATVIPQRERVTYLVHLSEVIASVKQLATAFAMVDGYMVLNVIPKGQGAARTIGCRYVGRSGEWWFYDVRSDEYIRPANDLRGAADHLLTQMGLVAAA